MTEGTFSDESLLAMGWESNQWESSIKSKIWHPQTEFDCSMAHLMLLRVQQTVVDGRSRPYEKRDGPASATRHMRRSRPQSKFQLTFKFLILYSVLTHDWYFKYFWVWTVCYVWWKDCEVRLLSGVHWRKTVRVYEHRAQNRTIKHKRAVLGSNGRGHGARNKVFDSSSAEHVHEHLLVLGGFLGGSLVVAVLDRHANW